MLENMPSALGRALRGVRAGFDKLASERPEFADAPDIIALESSAFEDGGSLPPRYTADGERISPPLMWGALPRGAAALALIVEDPDAPIPEPLVHLLAWDLPPDLRSLPAGQFRSPHHEGLDEVLGRNSYLQAGWLPPDPPSGHGPHLYAFQMFALDRQLAFDDHPRRSAVLQAMRGHVLARGFLTATYERP